ncbi:rfaE bifunctional protein, domain II [Actinacidiphila alni]|uniref:D-glycero-beta-D-manno-heptose 1-phosphate adenylyltransferase n=1 Tax=Actinacidiphila alni TaxID=380248 RepID=A0A1I2JWA2_9ACTN|nr:D-glycero-beta-D-manno-heptose 1-phosphate adenylyltransferase [Actinacidiphila alni]SFF59115.1 rfaE bifunctional protein, domain II [Actinacidiphila alni]
MTGRTPLLVVGDALLDHDLSGRADRLAPDAPVPVVSGAARSVRPGGAALAAWLAAGDGREVTLVTALGDDASSHEVRRLLAGRVELVELPLNGGLSTKTRILARGRPVVRLDDGDGRAGAATARACAAVAAAHAVLVSDYGRGTADALRPDLHRAATRAPLVWDPHPRGAPLVPGTRLATPSATEAHAFAGEEDGGSGPVRRDAAARGGGSGTETAGSGAIGSDTAGSEGAGSDMAVGLRDDLGSSGRSGALERTSPAWDVAVPGVPAATAWAGSRGDRPDGDGAAGALRAAARDAHVLVARWRVTSVVVTLAEYGALLSHGEAPLLVPTPRRAHGDACGAGDRFAATAACLLADGALTETAVRGAVEAATDYVAAGGAGSVSSAAEGREPAAGDVSALDVGGEPGPAEVVTRVHRAGGTVVAAGGCFDLLHAGHVGMLQAARRAGDFLVVCLNSDASVRRRKGPGRPLVPCADRMRVLRALECVDAVAVFDEDTPERLLAELRPDIWVKGADYARGSLPETALVESWGGQVVLLPYLDGRSTTRIARRAAEDRTPSVPVDNARAPQPPASGARVVDRTAPTGGQERSS